MRFDPTDKNGRHIIYGYLQIDEIIKIDKSIVLEEWMNGHPHTLPEKRHKYGNTIYVAKKEVDLVEGLAGFGVFNYSDTYVLSKEGHNRTKWTLPNLLKGLEISYHSNDSWKRDYFQSAVRGQEFVIQDDKKAIKWAKSLLKLQLNGSSLVSKVFDHKPDQWGLRGDLYLWNDLKSEFNCDKSSLSVEKFEIRLIELFREKTGHSLFEPREVFVEKYAFGGMSSGYVDVNEWRNRFIPLLIESYNND